MCRSPVGRWLESGLAGGRVKALVRWAGWDVTDVNFSRGLETRGPYLWSVLVPVTWSG